MATIGFGRCANLFRCPKYSSKFAYSRQKLTKMTVYRILVSYFFRIGYRITIQLFWLRIMKVQSTWPITYCYWIIMMRNIIAIWNIKLMDILRIKCCRTNWNNEAMKRIHWLKILSVLFAKKVSETPIIYLIAQMSQGYLEICVQKIWFIQKCVRKVKNEKFGKIYSGRGNVKRIFSMN